MSTLSYTTDDLLKLRPLKIESKLLENMFKPLYEAGLSELLCNNRNDKMANDMAVGDGDKPSEANTGDTQFTRAKSLFHNNRTRSSSGGSARIPGSNGGEFRPHPTLAAQKEEGFQRFYKAVISPTHVRVTAGGRIVPNTKAPPSPSPKPHRDRDANIENHLAAAQNSLPPNAYYHGYPQAAYGAQHPMYGFAPGMVPAVPYNPYGVGPIHGAIPMMAENGHHPASRPVTSDGSGPENADYRFGPARWMGPWGPQFPYAVPGMIPGHGYMANPFMAPPMSLPAQPTPGQVPVHSTPSMSVFNANTAPAPVTAPTTQAPATLSTNSRRNSVSASANPAPELHVQAPVIPAVINAPLNPPVSSIRPSQISRAHLESLRTNLRRVEDQLQYNVHQIDVPAMEQRAKEIREAIKGLEETLPVQLEYEEAHYPKIKEAKSSTKVLPPIGSHQREDRRRSVNHRMPILPRDSRSKAGSIRHGSGETESSKTGVAPTSVPFKSSNWDVKGEDDGVDPVKRAVSHNASRSSGSGSRVVSNYGSAADAALIKKTAKPYLEGELLPGMSEATAVENGFHYARPLTDDEVRARHLYWGRAPQSALRGLPKFDGKDFYFASPPKVRHSVRNTVGSVRNWGRRVSREDDNHSRKSGSMAEARNSDVSVGISATRLQSESTFVPSSNGSTQRENSNDTQVEEVKAGLAQKTSSEAKKSSEKTLNVQTQNGLGKPASQTLPVTKAVSPAQPSEALTAGDRSAESKQVTPTGKRDKSRRNMENVPPAKF